MKGCILGFVSRVIRSDAFAWTLMILFLAGWIAASLGELGHFSWFRSAHQALGLPAWYHYTGDWVHGSVGALVFYLCFRTSWAAAAWVASIYVRDYLIVGTAVLTMTNFGPVFNNWRLFNATVAHFIHPAVGALGSCVNDNIVWFLASAVIFGRVVPKYKWTRHYAAVVGMLLACTWVLAAELVPGFIVNTRDLRDIPAGILGALLTFTCVTYPLQCLENRATSD